MHGGSFCASISQRLANEDRINGYIYWWYIYYSSQHPSNPLRPRSTNQVFFDLHWFLVWDHFEFDTSWHHLQSHLLPAAEWQDTLPRGSEELCPSLVSTLQAYLQGQRHRFHLQNLGQIRTSDFWWLNKRATFLNMQPLYTEATSFKYCFGVPNQASTSWNFVNIPLIAALLSLPHHLYQSLWGFITFNMDWRLQAYSFWVSWTRATIENQPATALSTNGPLFKYLVIEKAWTHTVKYWKQLVMIFYSMIICAANDKIKIIIYKTFKSSAPLWKIHFPNRNKEVFVSVSLNLNFRWSYWFPPELGRSP